MISGSGRSTTFDYSSSTWAPRGKTPVLRHHFSWKRLSMAGALAYEPDGTDAQLVFQMRSVVARFRGGVGQPRLPQGVRVRWRCSSTRPAPD